MKRSAVGRSIFFTLFRGMFLLLASSVLFLTSCNHNDPVDPALVPKYVPTNNNYTQLLAIKDSLLPKTIDYNQILSIDFINRSVANSLSTFNAALGVFEPYDHQGVISNNTYYFLLRNNINPGTTLQFYDLASTQAYNIYIPYLYLSYLVHDSSTDTYFARSRRSPGPDSLVSFKVIGSYLSNYHSLLPIPANITSLTIDQVNHNIYMLSGSGTYQLNVYNGSSLLNIPFSAGNSTVLGIRYNQNDNFLYALQDSGIIKINPANGNITKLISQSYSLDPDTYGAVYDQYNNQYIISGIKKSSVDTGIFIIYDNNVDKIASFKTTPYCYLALSIRK